MISQFVFLVLACLHIQVGYQSAAVLHDFSNSNVEVLDSHWGPFFRLDENASKMVKSLTLDPKTRGELLQLLRDPKRYQFAQLALATRFGWGQADHDNVPGFLGLLMTAPVSSFVEREHQRRLQLHWEERFGLHNERLGR
jgi:hypothetical protein